MPDVHLEFEKENHAVSRSEQPFSQVRTDMALEQTVNLDNMMRGGIVGFSKNPAAPNSWFLSSQERSAVTAATSRCAMLRTVVELEAIKS